MATVKCGGRGLQCSDQEQGRRQEPGARYSFQTSVLPPPVRNHFGRLHNPLSIFLAYDLIRLHFFLIRNYTR